MIKNENFNKKLKFSLIFIIFIDALTCLNKSHDYKLQNWVL